MDGIDPITQPPEMNMLATPADAVRLVDQIRQQSARHPTARYILQRGHRVLVNACDAPRTSDTVAALLNSLRRAVRTDNAVDLAAMIERLAAWLLRDRTAPGLRQGWTPPAPAALPPGPARTASRPARS